MRYNYIVFDLDGTLFDTSAGIIKSVEKLLRIKGLRDLTEEEKISLIGPPIQDSLKRIYNLNDNVRVEFSNLFREIYLNEYLFDARLYDNMFELLQLLNESNCKVAIATYKRQDCTDSLIKHFNIDKYFSCIYGSDFEGKRSKQDIINLCIKDLNPDINSKVVMVGDSEFDAIGAEKSQLDFVGVTYGFGFKDKSQVEEYKNIFTAETVDELKKFLLNPYKIL